MSLAPSEVRSATDVFRCEPYKRRIPASACVSSQTAALNGTKSLAACIGCEDGACIAVALGGSPPPAVDDEPESPTQDDPITEPAPPPVEQKERPMAMTREEKLAKQRVWTANWAARKKAREQGLPEPPRAKPGPKAAPTPTKPKTVARKKPSPKAPKAVTATGRSLTEVATLLGIDVDAILGREIARALGLS